MTNNLLQETINEHVQNELWYKTEKGYYRLTEKGWNTISTKVRLGKTYEEYLVLARQDGSGDV